MKLRKRPINRKLSACSLTPSQGQETDGKAWVPLCTATPLGALILSFLLQRNSLWRNLIFRVRPTDCLPSLPPCRVPRDELYKNRSSRKIDSQGLFSREHDFPKTFSLTENQFSRKTYFYTIASRRARGWAAAAEVERSLLRLRARRAVRSMQRSFFGRPKRTAGKLIRYCIKVQCE